MTPSVNRTEDIVEIEVFILNACTEALEEDCEGRGWQEAVEDV
jgi:hypothetical protein